MKDEKGPILNLSGHSFNVKDEMISFVEKAEELGIGKTMEIATLLFLAYCDGFKKGVAVENERFQCKIDQYCDQAEDEVQAFILKHMKAKGEA